MVAQTQSKVLDQEGRPLCGANRTDRHNGDAPATCKLSAGWGTAHPGEGRCKNHGGDPRTSLDQVPANSSSTSYKLVVKHKRLRELLTHEEANDRMDSLDDEILLTRSMIALLAEKFGLRADKDSEVSESDDPMVLKEDAVMISKLIDQLSNTMRKKYEILQIAGEAIPRNVVRAYMTQVRLALSRTLRNECIFCHKEHRQREEALTALALIDSI